MQNQNAQAWSWGAGANAAFTAAANVFPPQMPGPGADQSQLLGGYQQLYGGAATAPPPAGYDPTQWTAAQMQHWQQWQQWQEKYQQWQEQYGKKYAESVAALQSPGMVLPGLTTLTAGIGKQSEILNPGYTTVNPPLPALSQPVPPPPPEEEKPPLPKGPGLKDVSDKNGSDASKDNPEDLSEAEKTFDIQFKQWEGQFNEWKKQNQDHPDKVQYREYEKKWESWREQLLQRREQMRKKRLSKTPDAANISSPAGKPDESKKKATSIQGTSPAIEKKSEPEYSYSTQTNQPLTSSGPFGNEPLKFDVKPQPYGNVQQQPSNPNLPVNVQHPLPDISNPPPNIQIPPGNINPPGNLMQPQMNLLNQEGNSNLPRNQMNQPSSLLGFGGNVEPNRPGNFPNQFNNPNFNNPNFNKNAGFFGDNFDPGSEKGFGSGPRFGGNNFEEGNLHARERFRGSNFDGSRNNDVDAGSGPGLGLGLGPVPGPGQGQGQGPGPGPGQGQGPGSQRFRPGNFDNTTGNDFQRQRFGNNNFENDRNDNNFGPGQRFGPGNAENFRNNREFPQGRFFDNNSDKGGSNAGNSNFDNQGRGNDFNQNQRFGDANFNQGGRNFPDRNFNNDVKLSPVAPMGPNPLFNNPPPKPKVPSLFDITIEKPPGLLSPNVDKKQKIWEKYEKDDYFDDPFEEKPEEAEPRFGEKPWASNNSNSQWNKNPWNKPWAQDRMNPEKQAESGPRPWEREEREVPDGGRRQLMDDKPWAKEDAPKSDLEKAQLSGYVGNILAKLGNFNVMPSSAPGKNSPFQQEENSQKSVHKERENDNENVGINEQQGDHFDTDNRRPGNFGSPWNFNQNRGNLGSKDDDFLGDQNNFGPNQGNFGNQGRFGPNKGNFGPRRGGFGTGQDRFGPPNRGRGRGFGFDDRSRDFGDGREGLNQPFDNDRFGPPKGNEFGRFDNDDRNKLDKPRGNFGRDDRDIFAKDDSNSGCRELGPHERGPVGREDRSSYGPEDSRGPPDQGPFGRDIKGNFGRNDQFSDDRPFGRGDRGPPNRDDDERPFPRDGRGPLRDDDRRSFGRDDRGPGVRDDDRGPFGREGRGPGMRDDDRGPFGRDDRGPGMRDDERPSFGRDDSGPMIREDDRGPFGRDDRGPGTRDDDKSPFGRDTRGPTFREDDRGPFGRDNRNFGRDDRRPFGRDDWDDRGPRNRNGPRGFDREDRGGRGPLDWDERRGARGFDGPFDRFGRQPPEEPVWNPQVFDYSQAKPSVPGEDFQISTVVDYSHGETKQTFDYGHGGASTDSKEVKAFDYGHGSDAPAVIDYGHGGDKETGPLDWKKEKEKEKEKAKENKIEEKNEPRSKSRSPSSRRSRSPRGTSHSKSRSPPRAFRRSSQSPPFRGRRSRSRDRFGRLIPKRFRKEDEKLDPPTADNETAKSSFDVITVLVEDLICAPGRAIRPNKFVFIMRGLPGSGKTYVTKLIKDKEVEFGGAAPRILSLDDYFMTEIEREEPDGDSGRKVKTKVMEYEYEAGMESHYRGSLLKAFKKTISDGFFSFIIVDSINEKTKDYEDMWSFAKQKGFQVYVAEMDDDVAACTKRNIHKRTEKEILDLSSAWEETPRHYIRLDVRSLLQADAITEVEMEVVSEVDTEKPKEEEQKEETEEKKDDEEDDAGVSTFVKSRWDTFENSEQKLDRLDGLKKRREGFHTTMEDYLQLPDEFDELSSESSSGKKRVRWADLEERRKQEKMRAFGFVVGQTDWNRMTDPTFGESALTRTKYI